MLTLLLTLASVVQSQIHDFTFASDTFQNPPKFVEPCSNRAFWNSLDPYISKNDKTDSARFKQMMPWNETFYFSKGTRDYVPADKWMIFQRLKTLRYYTFEECTAWNGLHKAKLNEMLKSIANQPTWVELTTMPKDITPQNYSNFLYVDLTSSQVAGSLATTLHLLGDVVEPDVKTLVKTQINRRILSPFKNFFLGTNPHRYFYTSTSTNWNAVCWSGVLVSAYLACDNNADKAYLFEKGKTNINYYLDSLTGDGYSTEGAGYYNFGFSHFSVVREVLLSASSGKIDLFDDPKIEAAALFAKEFSMSSINDAAAFSDCSYDNARIETGLDDYITKVFGFNQRLNDYKPLIDTIQGRIIHLGLKKGLVNKAKLQKTTNAGLTAIRKYYPLSKILVARPPVNAVGNKLYATLKLGGNDVGHYHLDVGSYVLSLNGVKLAGDVGGVNTYDSDKQTGDFSPMRFTRPIFNSYGHPVPFINSKNQTEDGMKAAILNARPTTNFSDSQDVFSFDMKDAYSTVPGIRNLIRTFTYSRLSNSQVLFVRDTFNFNSPLTFDSPLLTYYDFIKTSANTGYFYIANSKKPNGDKLYVTINASGPFTIRQPEVLKVRSFDFNRVPVVFNSPVSSGFIEVKYSTTP